MTLFSRVPRCFHSAARLLGESPVAPVNPPSQQQLQPRTSPNEIVPSTRPALNATEVFPADATNGAPPAVSHRTVRIYRPAKTAMQSGSAGSQNWKIDFDTLRRWENPLMGWASSADTVQGTSLKFTSKEDAIVFSERHGYDFWVDEPHETKFTKKNYSDNFKYQPSKLRLHKTK